MVSFEQQKKDRFLFLHLLYEKTGGDKFNFQNMFDIGSELGFDKDYTPVIVQYLEGEHLLEHKTIGGGIGITHYGVKEIEGALSSPESASQYFPPVNIIHIHSMQNSQIQQGVANSSQTVSIEIKNKNDIAGFISLLKEKLPELALDSDDNSEITTDISTIETQLSSVRPKNAIIRECFGSIQRILEGAGGGLIAKQLLPMIPPIMNLL